MTRGITNSLKTNGGDTLLKILISILIALIGWHGNSIIEKLETQAVLIQEINTRLTRTETLLGEYRQKVIEVERVCDKALINKLMNGDD